MGAGGGWVYGVRRDFLMSKMHPMFYRKYHNRTRSFVWGTINMSTMRYAQT